jgi:sulfite dehydrogenase (cytochrome) subunit B
MKMRALLPLLALLAASTALADEAAIKLKPGAGSEEVANACGACHSLDYPAMNSGFLDSKGWDAEVNKMIKVFGANIDDADAAKIKTYLTANYGK